MPFDLDGRSATAFFSAVDTGEVATLRQLALALPNLVNSTAEGWTGLPLHIAVMNRDANTARVLVELGADARQGLWPHRDATTAYTMAREREYDDVVAAIEEGEAIWCRASSPGRATVDSIIDLVNRAILQDRCDEAIQILESDPSRIAACNVGQPINGLDCRRIPGGATPLHVAAWKHNPQMVAWLLEHGAPVDLPDKNSNTPLDYAAMTAGWSAHGRDFSFLENSRQDPACFRDTVRLLRDKGAALTACAAVATADVDAVRRMHETGRLKNARGVPNELLSIAVKVNRIQMCELLLDLGFDPNEPEHDGDDEVVSGAPLWFASMCGRYDIAELLIFRGADVNAVFNGNADALYCAERTGDARMKAILLGHGARITVESIAGRKDLEAARAILEGRMPGSSLNVSKPTLTDLAEQMLWAAGSCDFEIVRMCLPYMTRKSDDPWWNYVLMHATLPECFELVLKHGVDPDALGAGGFTILQHLATATASEAHRVTRASMLLNAGASIRVRDQFLKSTPLGWACRWGRADLVQLYLRRGADVREPDAAPWATPLAWATKRGHEAIVELLRSHGAGR